MNRKNYKKGYVVITNIIFFLIISMVIVYGISGPVLSSYKIGRSFLESKKSFIIANSASEEALYKLKKNMTLSSVETLALAGGSATINTSVSGADKTISIDSASGDFQRNLQVKVTQGVGVSFHYGIQSGQGGFELSGGATINGNVYSNGDIVGSGYTSITGSAVAASSSALGKIQGVNIGSAGGFAWAHEVKNSTLFGALYCQTGSGNNKSCDTSRAEPAVEPLPISAGNINEWKAVAEAGGVVSGNQIYDGVDAVSIGPVKIIGNLTVTESAVVTLTDTVWVTGKILISGAGVVKLGTNFGANSGVIVADGKIEVIEGGSMSGSGTSGSQIMAITTSACPNTTGCGSSGSNYAVKVSGGTDSVILNAQNGTMYFTGGATAVQATANKIIMDGGTSINYETGISNMEFSSGPSGSWNLISWDEVE